MKKLTAAALSLMCLLLVSCSFFQEETAAGIYAPEINPQPAEGIMEQQTLLLYFPMSDEPYMCSQTRTKEVPANSPMESILLDELLNKGPTSPSELTSLMSNLKPSVNRNDSLIEVTLAGEFLSNAGVMESSAVKQRRRMTIYCIVNTLTRDERSLSVQILINDNGNVRKPTYDEVGITPRPSVSTDTLAPLTYSPEYILSTSKVVETVLDAAIERNEERMFKYLRDDENRPASPKDLKDIMISADGIIEDYNILRNTSASDDSTAVETVDIYLRHGSSSEIVNKSGIAIPLTKEGDVWKVDYKTIESAIFIKNEAPPDPGATADDQPSDGGL